jgi:hypothetical protein
VTDSLDAALRTLGVRCTVERRGPLAVVIPAVGERSFERADVRRQTLAILRAHGFTHAALESNAEARVDDERAGPAA